MTLAAFLDGPGRLGVRSVELPPARPDEVVISVQACAVCSTDLRVWSRGSRRGQPGVTGHEIAGVVTELGDGVTGLRLGDRVCVEPNLAVCCGGCDRCTDGRTYLCAHRRALPAWGFAEAMVIPAQAAIRIPDTVPTAIAALTEPLACTVHAIRQCRVAGGHDGTLAGRDMAIIGAGPVGLLALAAARHAGAARVVVAARHPHQRRLVEQLGGEPITEDPAQLAAVRPAIVLIAAGGNADLLPGALAAADDGGEVVVLGLLDQPQTIDARRAVLRGLRVSFSIGHGGWGSESDFREALEVMAADPAALAPILSHRFGLGDVAGAISLASDHLRPCFRVVVGPARET